MVVGISRADDDNDDDDLKIVGEKGQVACRDFPHARNLCAKYPFASTPHNVHCSQCHCYVCELPAPCLQWETVVPHWDHCHATDKDKYWKLERKRRKEFPTFVNTILSAKLHQTTLAPPPPPPPPNSLLQNKILMPIITVDPHPRHLCVESPVSSTPNDVHCSQTTLLASPPPNSLLRNENLMPITVNPHPRHLCVKFPFDSTPHDVHCSQCRCYVCDSRAPCSRWWGTGSSRTNHCHATDKEEPWRRARRLMKTPRVFN